MGGVLGCLACSAASCACEALCCACGKIATGILGRIGYTAIFFVVSLISWILRGWADEVLSWVPVLHVCQTQQCFGVLAIFRFTFPLAVFHLVHAIMFIGTRDISDIRTKIQDGFWPIKVLILAVGIFGSFFIPNSFFQVYGWIALIGSGIFIVVQLLLLVDFAHSWAEKWIQNYEETQDESSLWWWLLLGASGIFYIAAIVLTILMYIFFDKSDSQCYNMNTGFITTNLILVFVITLISIHPKIQEANPRSGLLQSSIITLYCTYLVWSALMSLPHGMGCNPFSAASSASTVSLVIGAVFTLVAVCFSTYSAAKSVGSEDQQPLISKEDEENKSTEEEKETVKETGPLPYNLTMFHLCFALGALYVAMLMSDWFTVNDQVENDGQKVNRVDSGIAATWVKIVSSWVSILLYIWTLAAPVLLPDRDWGYN